MKLIVGLGNPGNEYNRTRHNIGFMIVAELCKTLKVGRFKRKRSYGICQKNEWLFLLPRTYMNLSGRAVRPVVQQQKISLNDLLIISDDSALPLGTIRVREKGSDGGHRGLRSIIGELQSSAFPRLRVGIAPRSMDNHATKINDLREFVLDPFSTEELQLLEEKVIPQAVSLVIAFLQKDFTAMSETYSRLRSLSVS